MIRLRHGRSKLRVQNRQIGRIMPQGTLALRILPGEICNSFYLARFECAWGYMWPKLGDCAQKCDNTCHFCDSSYFKHHLTKKEHKNSEILAKFRKQTECRSVGLVSIWPNVCPSDQARVWKGFWLSPTSRGMYGRCTVIFGGNLLHAVHIDLTKHLSAVILSAVDSHTVRNYQPLGRWVGTGRDVYVHTIIWGVEGRAATFLSPKWLGNQNCLGILRVPRSFRYWGAS